jgi:hypothetical protein
MPPSPLPFQEESEKQLHLTEAQTKEALLALLPELSVLAHEVGGRVVPRDPHWPKKAPKTSPCMFLCRITVSGCRNSKRKVPSC